MLGKITTLEDSGFYGNSAEPSDYSGKGGANDVALYFSDSAASNYSMKNNVYFSNSTLLVMLFSQVLSTQTSIRMVMTVMPMAYWTPMVAGLTTHLMLMN